MSGEPRMLALDLDGTTLTRARTVNPIDRSAIRALQRRGIYVTICTGRLWSGTARIARQLGIHGLVACMNGGELRNVGDARVVHGRYLAPEIRLRTRAHFVRHGFASYLFASECVHHDEAGEPYLQYLRSWSDVVRWHDHADFASRWSRDRGVLATAASGGQSAVQRVAEAARAELPDTIETMVFPSRRSDRWFVKMRDGRDTKGSALTPIAASVGLVPSQVVALGDWLNDLPMFADAGRSFAMAQAPASVRRAASDVCAASSDRGGAIAEVAQIVWGVTIEELNAAAV